VAASALCAAGCSVQSELPSYRSQLLGNYTYTAERRIRGRIHTFRGTENVSVPRIPVSESVVHWTDTTTGMTYITKVNCGSGWLLWLVNDEDCIDVISPYEHSRQLPGD
jgi:hypothetical protein